MMTVESFSTKLTFCPLVPFPLVQQRRADGFRQHWSSNHFVSKLHEKDSFFKSDAVADAGVVLRDSEVVKQDEDLPELQEACVSTCERSVTGV
jgi:hypothetical protein